MTKQEIIAEVAYVNAPANARIVTRSVLEGVQHSKVVSNLPPTETKKMAICGFLEVTAIMNTQRCPNEPTGELFTKLHEVALAFKNLASSIQPDMNITLSEIEAQSTAMIERIRSIATKLNIYYDEPGK